MHNKIVGICKEAVEEDGKILLQTRELPTQWWKGVGDKAKNLINVSLENSEIELTIVNNKKRSFSYLRVLNGNVQCNKEI